MYIIIVGVENITPELSYSLNSQGHEVFVIDNNFEKINFRLVNSGISAEINFDNQKSKGLVSGIFKSKILDSRLRFNFEYDHKQLNHKDFHKNHLL